MALPVGLFGLVIASFGLLGLVAPGRLLGRMRRLADPAGIWLVAGIRLLFAALLLIASEASRAPLFLQVVGVLSFASGVLAPVLGPARAARMVDWWEARSELARVSCAAAVLFGMSLVWAVLPSSA